ncbi:SDR family NAD(P)-dependent oxidoreductase [Pseudodesulfovibrio methanolicus]|uniref:SDR family NAD(P)-dependent oxidoreductase n=1 Tax=Pseudodesulfovibrio methanolicus TaxID=3126690 RepID=A0ABZ2IZU9_9BACT
MTSLLYLTNIPQASTEAPISDSAFILDQSFLAPAAVQASRLHEATEVYLRSTQLLAPEFESAAKALEGSRVWVEILPSELLDVQETLSSLQKFSAMAIVPVTGNHAFAKTWLEANPEGSIALKGVESSGLVSADSIQVLYSAVGKEAGGASIYVWGGLGTSEAAAAFIGSGAAGVVFESVHWLNSVMGLTDVGKDKIRKLRYDSTTVVGTSTGMPWRFFDKGNSKAVRQLTKTVDCLGDKKPEEAGRQLALEVMGQAVEPLSSDFSAAELIPLGPEAAFASSFEKKYGSSMSAFTKFAADIRSLLESSPQRLKRFDASPAAASLGVNYPIIQGGMTWITDNFAFAREVERAGALPTITLGMRNTRNLEQDFGAIHEEMGDRPYAINALLLDENPFRDEQLAWIEKIRPPFVTIAAGDPAFVKQFAKLDIRVIYLAATVDLLKLAVKAGADFVVLEGNEAGGHVGENSTLSLAQAASVLRQEMPDFFAKTKIIIAGGIYDRKTAYRAAMLGADGVQMGTAYLATREIIETGALRQQYQKLIVEAKPGGTVLSGESIGLRVRSLKTPKLNDICTMERDLVAKSVEESERRMALEKVSVGTLFVAARGINREDGTPLSDEYCLREGQFMSGAVSGNISSSMTLDDLHSKVASGPMLIHGLPKSEMATATGAGSGHERIAITGMAAVNSLGNNYQDIFEASVNLKSGVSTIPAKRWDHSKHMKPGARMPNVYTNVGAFIDIEITRKDINVSPQDFRTMAESTRLTLLLAKQALEESGLLNSDIEKSRIAVITSQNSAETASTFKDQLIHVYAEEIVDNLAKSIPMTAEQRTAAINDMRDIGTRPDDTTLIGRLNCTAAGYICNQYALNGPSYSVGAACASSLIALHCALMLLRQGIIDAAVIGGGEEILTPGHYYEFCAIGSLAGMSGVKRTPAECSRPFDKNRDGFVLGEGGSMVVIERESVARARGAKSHAYITGIGACTNHEGIVESISASQQIALNASFADVPYGPDEVDLIECHGTSTNQGDREEIRALAAVFPQNGKTVLSSFKSQIGHTLGASGITSLIRGVNAMKHGVLPASLNHDTPDPEIGIKNTGLRILSKPEPWPSPEGRPRRLQVNAFGFGGASLVVHLEGTEADRDRVWSGEGWEPVQKAAAPKGGLVAYPIRGAFGSARVATAQASRTEVESLLAGLKGKDAISNRFLRKLASNDVFVGQETSGKGLAWVFSGQGGWYIGMGKELYSTVPGVRETLDFLNGHADFDLLDLMFEAAPEKLQKTRWQQPALFALEYAIAKHLVDSGMRPDAVAGHSLGEFTALCVAGVLSAEDAFTLVCNRGRIMDEAAEAADDPGGMVATNTPLDILTRKLKRFPNAIITNYNSPGQTVLGGPADLLDDLVIELKDQGFLAIRLKVSMAFHSSIMAGVRDAFRSVLNNVTFNAPAIPVASNVTGEIHENSPEAIKNTMVEHLESPVLWTQNTYTLWEGLQIRSFLEIGPSDTLCTFIGDILPKAECRATCREAHERNQLLNSSAWLCAKGYGNITDGPVIDLNETASPAPIAKPAAKASASGGSILEQVIQIIMDSTGYERDEIEPSMNIRQDLNIRSSRLPVIMDEAEHIFDIEIRIEDFIGVETINDLATRIAEIKGVDINADTAPAAASTSGKKDVLEQVIQIIMDSTGYERDEIEPSMNIRQDLNIRSSRLPVIMDEAEKTFDIEICIEDFIGVETINDLATRIAEIKGVDINADAAPAAASTSGKKDVLEQVIQIIMDSTGYERDEIEPSMNIRQDLNIRSSRLPVIMDEAEKTFDIEICIEDFIGVETINDLASKISELKGGAPVTAKTSAKSGAADPAKTAAEPEAAKAPLPVLRYDFAESVADAPAGPPAYTVGGNAIVVATLGGSSLSDATLAWVADKLQSDVVTADLTEEIPVKTLAKCQGLILLLDEAENRDSTQTIEILSQIFPAMKAFAANRTKQFCIAMGKAPKGVALSEVGEGVLGILLAAAMEYTSTVFRYAAVEHGIGIADVLDRCVSSKERTVDLVFRNQGVMTRTAQPVAFKTGEQKNRIKPDDVVVITGGGKGVTAAVAESVAALDVKLALLGRSPETAPDTASTISNLKGLGCQVMYHSCDIADAKAVEKAVNSIAAEYGRVDAVIHGAGLLKDSFLQLMEPEDFKLVLNVKLQGMRNVVEAASRHGLEFAAAFSSVAAWHGNVGQANYCAANRAMAAYLNSLTDRGIAGKALWLPPVDGIGMANDPEVKKLLAMKSMGQAYVPIASLSKLIRLEIATETSGWTMLSRPVKDPASGKRFPAGPEQDALGLAVGDLPMIDTVSELILEIPEIRIKRAVSHARDPWLPNHKPYPMLKYPLFSAVMAVESFLETAKALYPEFTPTGVRNVRFLDMIPCAEATTRELSVVARGSSTSIGKTLVSTSLACRDMSPKGRQLDRWNDCYTAEVAMAAASTPKLKNPIMEGTAPLPSASLSPSEITDVYAKYTAQLNRYQVIKEITGADEHGVTGVSIYGEEKDFSAKRASYQYSPYLLEALMQLVLFQPLAIGGELSPFLPVGIGEMQFSRRCEPGETVMLKARLRKSVEGGSSWDGVALDDEGNVLMIVEGLFMKRIPN